MIVEVRPCCESDIVPIWKFNCEALGHYYPMKATEQKLRTLIQNESHRIIVAIINNEVVGYAHACNYDVLYGPHMKDLLAIAVSEKHRHHGIGSALLEQIENWARATGAKGVRLVTNKIRVGAHAFYRNRGYTCTKDQKNFKKMI